MVKLVPANRGLKNGPEGQGFTQVVEGIPTRTGAVPPPRRATLLAQQSAVSHWELGWKTFASERESSIAPSAQDEACGWT